jgi:hypothetical protein
MSAVPLRVHIRLKNIVTQLFSGGTSYVTQAKTLYLWTVFFKVDGSTVQVNSSLKLQGTGTVVPTPGNQGDLPGGISASPYLNESTPIPSALGDYVTELVPIPVSGTSLAVGGVIGYAVILLYQEDTPASAVEAGHQALNSSLQQGLDNLIPTLGATNQTITQADVQNITNQILAAVQSAVKNNLSLAEKLGTLLNDEFQDSPGGNTVVYFTESQLAASPPQGIPLNSSNSAITEWDTPTGSAPTPQYTFTFSGTVVADPLPFSLRRILTGLGHAPPAGVRAVMGSAFTPSLLAWINSVR